jgi:hypothetical protein
MATAAWGCSWAQSWANSWGDTSHCESGPIPPEPPAVEQPSGGGGFRLDYALGPQRRKKKEERAIVETVAAVAKQGLEGEPGTDQLQALELALRLRLEAQSIEWRQMYAELLVEAMRRLVELQTQRAQMEQVAKRLVREALLAQAERKEQRNRNALAVLRMLQ